ncbi:MAG: MFS transporter [Deltaproteobacteria bacterium]|nr:MFS transporter [Deltaproteobacteria bacterium]
MTPIEEPTGGETTQHGRRYPFAALVMLLVTTVGLGFSIGIFTPAVAAKLDAWGVSPLVNGLTSTVMYFAIGLGALLAGRMVKGQGARWTFLVGAAGLSVTAALFPALPNLAAWFVLRAFAGLFAALFFVSTEVAVGLIGDPRKRARNLAFYGIAFSVGFSSGAGTWPLFELLGPWAPLYAASAASALGAVLALFLFTDARPSRRDRPERRGKARVDLKATLVVGFSYGFCEAVVTALITVYCVRVGYSTDTSGFFLMLIVGTGLVTHIPVGLIADRVGPMRLTRIATVVALAGVALPLLYVNDATLIVTCILAGAGVGSLYTLGLAEVGRRVDSHTLAYANSRFTAAYGIGSVLGPAVGGLAIYFIGAQGFFWSLTVCVAVLMLVIFGAHPPAQPPGSIVPRVYSRYPLDLVMSAAIDEWP